MAYPVTINGRTYTLADFEGTNYVDGFPDALEDFVTQAGDIYNSTSTTSNTVGTGSKTFTTADSGKPYQAGTPLRIADAAAPATNWMDCIVTSYSGTTLVVSAFGYAGSGTKTSWNINIGGAKTVDGTLAIAQGGTGATTASAAADNLGLGTGDSPTFAGATLTGDLTIPDKIIHAGDTNTAIRFPAADTVTVETGGDERVRVDSSGRVGIGITPGSSFLSARQEIKTADLGSTSGDTQSLQLLLAADNNQATLQTIAERTANGSSHTTSQYTIQRVVDLTPNSHISFASGHLSMGGTSSEHLRIDSSGNVGIGTTSPASTLHVAGKTTLDGLLDLTAATTETRSIELGKNRTGDGFAFIDLIGDATYTDYGLRIIRSNTGANAPSQLTHRGTGEFEIEAQEAAPLVFKTSANERMRIDSSGDVIFGATTASTAQVGSNVDAFGYDASAGQVAIANDSQNAPQLICNSSNYGSGTAEFVWFRTNGNTTPVGSITYTGTATAYNTSSDARLKENIEDAGDAGSIVDAIRVRQFDWKESGAHQGYGFVAQELVEHFPDAVSPLGDEDYLGVDNSKLVPLLLKELQSLRARVAELEAKA